MNGSRVISGASEIMGLLRTLGEGYRLSCMYMCQVLPDFLEETKYSCYLNRKEKKTGVCFMIIMEVY
jgi:hypothetical protein